MVVNKRLPATEQAGAAGTEAAHSGQVGVVEDGQLDGEAAPHTETGTGIRAAWRAGSGTGYSSSA